METYKERKLKQIRAFIEYSSFLFDEDKMIDWVEIEQQFPMLSKREIQALESGFAFCFEDLFKEVDALTEIVDSLCSNCCKNMYIKTGQNDLREFCESSDCLYAKYIKKKKEDKEYIEKVQKQLRGENK